MILLAVASFVFSVQDAPSVFDNAQLLAQGFNILILVDMDYRLLCHLLPVLTNIIAIYHCVAPPGIHEKQDFVWGVAVLLVIRNHRGIHQVTNYDPEPWQYRQSP